jgi:hypothetical protein
MAKFLLPKEQVLDGELSDHMPQVFTCGGKVRVLTWNIMTQCRNTTFCNNGFGKNESDEDYETRLKDIAGEVAEFFRQNKDGLPMIAALQECPLKDEFRRALLDGIEQSLPSIKFGIRERATSRSFANVTLWDASQWRLQREIPRGGLLARALITHLVPVRAACPPCRFINVHLEWKAYPDLENKVYHKHVENVAEAVRESLVDDGLVVVAGDFNMNVLHTRRHLGGVEIQQIPRSSQVWKDGYPPQLNTVDGIMWDSEPWCRKRCRQKSPVSDFWCKRAR